MVWYDSDPLVLFLVPPVLNNNYNNNNNNNNNKDNKNSYTYCVKCRSFLDFDDTESTTGVLLCSTL